MIIIAVVTFLMVTAAWFYRKNTDTKRIIRLGMLITGIFWMIQVVQLPYYTNSIVGGRVIQNDSIQIANYLNREEYESLYYVYENEEEENHCDDEACNDYQECVFDTTHVAAGLYSVALGSVRLLSFHNLIVLLNLNLLKIDSFFVFGAPAGKIAGVMFHES